MKSKTKIMTKKDILGNFLFVGGAIITYWSLFVRGTTLDRQEDLVYIEPPKPDILVNDDRETYTGSSSTQSSTNATTDSGAIPNPTDNTVKGYPMPEDINKLNPIGNQIWIISKPDTKVFGQDPRGMFPLIVDFPGKQLVYKPNYGNFIAEKYIDVKDKIVLSDKKYLKA